MRVDRHCVGCVRHAVNPLQVGGATQRAVAAAAAQNESELCSLGQEALNALLQQLPVKSLLAISRTCRYMNDACLNIVPGAHPCLNPNLNANPNV
jgi:hypothetical protein